MYTTKVKRHQYLPRSSRSPDCSNPAIEEIRPDCQLTISWLLLASDLSWEA